MSDAIALAIRAGTLTEDGQQSVTDALLAVAEAVRNCAHGGVTGPAGLEGLSMALMSGINGEPGVASALHDVAEALREIATAISAKET